MPPIPIHRPDSEPRVIWCGPSVGEKQWTVMNGDCRKAIPLLYGDGSLYNFIFADPPFNINQEYTGYVDRIPPGDYAQFILQAITRCEHALSPTGVMALHGNDAMADLYLHVARTIGLRRVAWVNWHYRFGQCGRGNWIDARCHCLIYAKNPKRYTWNPDAVLVDSDRATVYGDKRVHETANGGKRVPGTIWGVPSDGQYWGRVSGAGSNKERRAGHPNQLPEVYLGRLLLAYTNPGDRVLDPFGGSGTTITVAKALGRRCDTIDISRETCLSIVERLKKGSMRY